MRIIFADGIQVKKCYEMAASSKQYGRSNSSLMDSIFTKQVSSDPFLFDSGGSDGDSQPSLNTSKKKFKVSLGQNDFINNL